MDPFVDAVRRVSTARGPADLFDGDPGERARVYRRLAKVLHPDRVGPDRVAEATAAFARLSSLWAASSEVRMGPYRAGAPVAHDEVADYLLASSDVDVLLKVAHRPADNDLLRREAALLPVVWRHTEPRHVAYLPSLLDSFTYTDETTGADHAVNVFACVDGLVSLAAVRSAYPDGLDARDVAWMWRRLLVALGLAHRAGVVHGAVIPDHILIHPGEHGLVLVNWCYASGPRWWGVPALVARYRDWYAPELLRRGAPTPGSDIYLATRCMVALLGERAPAPLSRFARGCLLASPRARPGDAWRLLAELDDVLGRLFGPRRFRPFALPATVPPWPHELR